MMKDISSKLAWIMLESNCMTNTGVNMQDKSRKLLRAVRLQTWVIDGLIVVSFVAVFYTMIFLLSK
jgi:hypothetical protein